MKINIDLILGIIIILEIISYLLSLRAATLQET